MAIDEKGDFYMVYNGIGVDELWKFSLGTQIESFVGYIGSDSIQALDFDVFGTLYAWSVRTDRTGGLWTIDPSTGQGRDAFPNIGGPVNVQSIAFDYLNRCWAVGYDLILLNVDDQSMVQVGQGGLGDMRGCEFATRKVVPTNVFVKFHSDTNGTIASFRADDFDFFQAIRSAGLGDTTPIVYDIRATGQNGLPTGIQAWVKSRIAVGSASTLKLQLRHGGTTILDTVDVLTEPETSIFKTHKLAGTGDITRYALSNTIGMLVTVTPNSMPTASTWRDDTSFAFWTYEINGL